MNSLPKHVQTVSLQPDYVSTLPNKAENNTKTTDHLLQYILLNRLFQIFAKNRFLAYLLESSFSSLLTENLYILMGFYQKIIFKLNMVYFNM